MKTLKLMLAGIILLFICVAANAAPKPATGKLTKDDVIKIYIDAVANGKIKNLDNVLDNDLQFNMQRGENVNTLDKNQLLDYLKNNATSNSQVTTTTTIIEDYDDSYVVKIEFKYDGFVRTDEITLANSNGWEVTKVTSVFK